jgi:hypothetical protein
MILVNTTHPHFPSLKFQLYADTGMTYLSPFHYFFLLVIFTGTWQYLAHRRPADGL